MRRKFILLLIVILAIYLTSCGKDVESGSKQGEAAENIFYTVEFRDNDGVVLKTEQVKSGAAATAPADPSRDGYTFTGWDKTFNNVTEDMTVTAVYTENITGPYLSCEDQSVDIGSTVSFAVSLLNSTDPIDALAISISDNSGSFTVTKGSWSSDNEYEISNFNKSKLQGVARLSEKTVVSGDIFNLTLQPADTLESGVYTIGISLKITYFDSNEDEIEIPCQSVEVSITVN